MLDPYALVLQKSALLSGLLENNQGTPDAVLAAAAVLPCGKYLYCLLTQSAGEAVGECED
jgi:hypothetical protein